MNDTKRKKITMKLKTPNPLFQKWLAEWRDRARNENSKMEFCFNTALQSLKKYPLPLERGKDCKILKGFGEKLCLMIDNKLKAHQSNLNSTITGQVQNSNEKGKRTGKTRKPAQSNSTSKIDVNCSKKYFPQEGSGGYAILLALYLERIKPNYIEILTKQEIIKKGQHLCRTSFTKPDPGSRYTAWSSMKTLIARNLAIRKSNPPKFSLSSEGLALGKKLFENRKSSDSTRDTSCPSYIQTSKTKYETKEDTYVDLSKDAHLHSLSVCSSYNGSEVLAESESNFPSKQEKHQEKFNTDMIKPNSSITSVKDDMVSLDDETGLSLRKTICPDLVNKTKSKLFQNHMSNSSHASSTTSLTQDECFILLPNSFDIILYVDVCETSGSMALIQDDPILAELKQFGVAYEVKKLKIGDYIWICRDRTSKNELVLPYIIERKRMDDFGHSIKDGRYYEQKFRLKKCGVQNKIYLIEKIGNNQHVGLPITTLYQAATNTAIQDGFCVKFTENIRDTAKYLANFSAIMNKIFKSKTLVGCPKDNISDISLEDDLISIMTFQEFNHTSSKNKPTNVSDLFVKMLIQIKGMSVDRALAIVDEYSTLALLMEAYDKNPGERGEKLLASIRFGNCSKNIGPALSKIVHQLFTLGSFH